MAARTLTALTLAATATTAHAQSGTARADVSAGYLNVMGSMNGWNIQASVPTGRRLSLIGEFNTSAGPDGDRRYQDTGVLAGVRFGWHPTPRVSPFWQVVAGGLRSRAGGAYYDSQDWNPVTRTWVPTRYYSEGYVVDYFAFQPGGGLTVMLNSRVGIRAQTDLQLAIPDQSEWEGLSMFPRMTLGTVVRLGR